MISIENCHQLSTAVSGFRWGIGGCRGDLGMGAGSGRAAADKESPSLVEFSEEIMTLNLKNISVFFVRLCLCWELRHGWNLFGFQKMVWQQISIGEKLHMDINKGWFSDAWAAKPSPIGGSIRENRKQKDERKEEYSIIKNWKSGRSGLTCLIHFTHLLFKRTDEG